MVIVGNGELWWVIDFLPFENWYFGPPGIWTPDFLKKKMKKSVDNCQDSNSHTLVNLKNNPSALPTELSSQDT